MLFPHCQTASPTPGPTRSRAVEYAAACAEERRREQRCARRRTARAIGLPVLLAAVVVASAPGWSSYRIRQGDTLSEIALRYHVSVAQLVRANHLPGNGDLIYAGRTLRVPGAAGHGRSSGGRSSGGRASRIVSVQHRVVIGDSLWKIARNYRISQSVIARANSLPRSGMVRLGETLRIPLHRRVAKAHHRSKPRHAHNSFAGRTYASAVVRAASRNRAYLARAEVPSRYGMRDVIVRTSRAFGVDPNLALAVSWQESGWNQRRVSVANAIGAMQVIPTTAEWMSGVLGRDLNPLRAQDNAVIGVALLKTLDRVTSTRKAVAGYYQGLASVRRHGMYPDTKRYVANIMALRARFARS